MTTDTASLAAALVADGFNPPPAIEQLWEDIHAAWLPEGHRRLVRLTSIALTVSGWQCQVTSWTVDEDGEVPWPGELYGVMYLDALVAGYRLVES